MSFDLRGLARYYGVNRSVGLFLLASVLVHTTMGALNVVLNLYIMELGFSEEFAGLITSLKLFANGLICIPAGIYVARVGYRRGLMVASAAQGVGVLVMALFPTPTFIGLGAILIGVAQAAKAVSSAPFMVESCPPQARQNLFSLNFSLMMFANMAGNAISGWMPSFWVDSLQGYAGTIQVFGLITLVSLAPLMGVAALKAANRQSIGRQLAGSADLLRREPALGRMLLCHASIGFGAGLIVPLFNIFLSGKLGASSGQIGVVMSLAQTATAVGGLLMPLIVSRLKSQVAAITIMRLASIPFLIMIATLTNFYGVATVFFLRSALMNMTNPVESNFSMEMVDAPQRSVWSSLLKTMDTLTRAFSVLVGGWLMTRFSYDVPYFFTCGLYLATTVAFWYWFRPVETRLKDKSAA